MVYYRGVGVFITGASNKTWGVYYRGVGASIQLQGITGESLRYRGFLPSEPKSTNLNQRLRIADVPPCLVPPGRAASRAPAAARLISSAKVDFGSPQPHAHMHKYTQQILGRGVV